MMRKSESTNLVSLLTNPINVQNVRGIELDNDGDVIQIKYGAECLLKQDLVFMDSLL